ncbi:hypothetical protein AU255_04930 [Methyloprofundus sedimenti]|uniref:Uncharacterized protein n=1 Tax=Methyloprofundus sedimenti TaxID=1420851 RepID=A0A1V8M6R1_9GAMM|nr:glycerophosphoryl diester phosphodiesterase membrane domain-containing protein [Methyloprofundus sedimenti]OQK17239.1 hypothetical protein AU255_04930 [Methyloprofundus sedimenti]
MQTNQHMKPVSGSLQEGIAAPYDFTVSEVFQEAWQRTSGFKAPVLGAVLIIFLALTAISVGSILLMNLFNMVDPAFASILTGVFNFLISLASYPLFAGVLMMGLYRAVDAAVDFNLAFSYFSYSLPIIIAACFASLLVMLGFMLLVIPGIYLCIAYIFTLPLIIEKGMDFWQAMETSRKAVHQHWFKIFFIYVMIGIIYLISLIPFGIGLIWAVPFFVALHGVLYRRIFGIDAI